MKILRVISSLDPKKGGPVEGIKQFQPYLSDKGVKVDVVCCDDPESAWIKNNCFAHVYAVGEVQGNYGYSPKLKAWLVDNVAQYDAVIIHGLWQYHSFAAWSALKGSKVPYYVFTHGMLDPWFKRKYPLKHLKKWLYWPWAEYKVLRDAKKVIFTCEDERLLARESFWLYKVNEAITAYGIENPPTTSTNKFIDEHPQLRGKRIILFLSRIQEKKGCELLIEAFAKLRDKDKSISLVMAGPDQTGWVPILQAKALELGVSDEIVWPGMLEGGLKWSAFYSAEIFCLPSHQENFGIVVAEALACGKPVLISDKVNIWREVEGSGAGLVAEDTVVGTLENLEGWLNMSAKEVKVMEDNALLCFKKHFHVKQAVERFFCIIKES